MANIYGIDVSEHNGTLDWAKIKSSGISFAIIRTGYGKSYTDKQFAANIKGAIAQGIPVGIYHFSYALDVEGVKKEAAFVLSLLAPYKEKISLPVFFDFEYDTIDYAKGKGVALGKQAFNDHTVAFCEAVKAAGYIPGTYYNLDYKRRFVDDSRLGGYVQWYAQYASKPTWTGYDLWQYSSSHRIDGINSRFDINVADDSILNLRAGWQKDEYGWWYRNPDGTYPKEEWYFITNSTAPDGAWYYFNDKGYALINTAETIEGKTYLFDQNGHATVKEEEDMFKDVSENAWYAESVEYVTKNGIMQGVGGEKFEPDRAVTRAELAQALANLHKKSSE